MTLYLVSLFTTTLALGVIILRINRETDMVKTTLSSLLCVYVFHKFIHPNYWSWAIPFLVVYALKRKKTVLPWMAFASISLSPFYDLVNFPFYGFLLSDLVRELVIPFLLLLVLLQTQLASSNNQKS